MKLGNLKHSLVQIGYIPTYPEIEAAKQKSLMAQMRGYTLDKCIFCENYTLLRSGMNLKCDCCGSIEQTEERNSPELPEISGSFHIQTATWNTTQKTSDILLK